LHVIPTLGACILKLIPGSASDDLEPPHAPKYPHSNVSMRGDGVGGRGDCQVNHAMSILTGHVAVGWGVASMVRMDCVPRVGSVIQPVKKTAPATLF
jgi:hypothetical protein